ncbi:metallopeptidase family protein [Raineyella sp. LH-20]|uniref:metallopeptidase family protein n=1 Tax=Raineyella sp. LH-20 TaxID=3081204 RepID=UPI0029559C20|nr:metallopeptidase family protein [Raineyella sp. LH-20]WOP18715.1 metallopeptidase family protein [Raineyella sp. LH-20]
MSDSWHRSRRRDRHGRGIRGPLALPNPWTGRPVRAPQAPDDREFFATALAEAIAAIAANHPRVLDGISVGMEDVPDLPASWAHDSVPLAAAVESPDGRAAEVVLYRRPLQLRAASREGLRILVRRTLVEQLAVVTGLTPDEIDPEGPTDEE